MKTTLLILTLGLMFGFASCEQNVGDANLVYVEELVIRAQITAGDTVNNILISHTLPPLEQYSAERAEISDADARIVSEGKEYKLKYIGYSIYSTDSLVPQVGKTYEIQVRWRDKYAWAITTIPQPPVIDSIYGQVWVDQYHSGLDTGVTIKAKIRPIADVSYLGFDLIYFENEGKMIMSKVYVEDIYRKPDTGSEVSTGIPLIKFYIDGTSDWREYFNFNLGDHYFGVEAFDKDFYDYYVTRWDSHQTSNPFGSSGINTRWNIKGDGVGMFIGTSMTMRKVRF